MDVALQGCQQGRLAWRPRHSPLSATGIGRDNDAVLSVEVLPNVAEEGRLGVQVVDWAELAMAARQGTGHHTWNAEEAWRECQHQSH
jgi:hypothetical protein